MGWFRTYSNDLLTPEFIARYTTEEVGVYVLLFSLAAESEIKGQIGYSQRIGLTDNQIAQRIGSTEEVVARTIKKMISDEVIVSSESNVLYFPNWKKYQSNYDRVALYRESLKNVKNSRELGKVRLNDIEKKPVLTHQIDKHLPCLSSISSGETSEERKERKTSSSIPECFFSEAEIEAEAVKAANYYSQAYAGYMTKYGGKKNHPGYFNGKDVASQRCFSIFKRVVEMANRGKYDWKVFINAQMWAAQKRGFKIPVLPNQLVAHDCISNLDRYSAEAVVNKQLPKPEAKIDKAGLMAKFRNALGEFAIGKTDEQVVAAFHFEIRNIGPRVLQAFGVADPEAIYKSL
jgi:hypothetical protein